MPMSAPRRGRPPKPPDEVRTVRVTVLLTEREHATLLRACGGRGVASLLVRGGLRAREGGEVMSEVIERDEMLRARESEARSREQMHVIRLMRLLRWMNGGAT